MNDTLMNCINEVANLSNTDKINIKGKFYVAVDTRVDIFRKHFGSSATITTDIVTHDLERVVVKATVAVKADGDYLVIGSGYAEEFRGDGMVNKTSALENCETSAIGRALAACGLGGGAYASSFEVDNAINSKPANNTGKYKILDPSGTSLKETNDPARFLVFCRTFMSNPKDAKCRELYSKNKLAVSAAMSKATGETQDSLLTLINLYSDAEVK